MSEMNRERFDDLKEAYALGALSDTERREVEGYMTLHPELRQEVEEFSSIANMLALVPAEYEPPAKARRDLMRIVNSEAGNERTGQSSALSKLRGYLSLRTLAPAAMAVIVVALLGWNVLLQGEVQNLQGDLQKRQTFAMQGSGTASDTNAEVVKLENGQSIVVAENMPSTPGDKTMQIWVIKGETPQPAGTFKPGSGSVATSIDGSLEKADVIAITVEPAGGSDEPTSEPVLQTSLPT